MDKLIQEYYRIGQENIIQKGKILNEIHLLFLETCTNNDWESFCVNQLGKSSNSCYKYTVAYKLSLLWDSDIILKNIRKPWKLSQYVILQTLQDNPSLLYKIWAEYLKGDNKNISKLEEIKKIERKRTSIKQRISDKNEQLLLQNNDIEEKEVQINLKEKIVYLVKNFEILSYNNCLSLELLKKLKEEIYNQMDFIEEYGRNQNGDSIFKERLYLYQGCGGKNNLLLHVLNSIENNKECILTIEDENGKSWIENPYLPSPDLNLSHVKKDSKDLFYFNLENFKSSQLDPSLYKNMFLGCKGNVNLLETL